MFSTNIDQYLNIRYANSTIENTVTIMNDVSYVMDGLMQNRFNSSVLAMELHLFRITPLMLSKFADS